MTDAGSQASLIKSGLASSSSSSVAASKRTLTSHDGVLAVPAEPDSLPPSCDRSPPSYLRVSRSVGGYSTFTSYAPDRRLPQVAAADALPPPGANYLDAATATVGGGTRVSEVPKGGQQCCVTLVDDVVADVRTLSNGASTSSNIVNGEDSLHCASDVIDDAVDGLATDCRTSAIDVKVRYCSRMITCYTPDSRFSYNNNDSSSSSSSNSSNYKLSVSKRQLQGHHGTSSSSSSSSKFVAR